MTEADDVSVKKTTAAAALLFGVGALLGWQLQASFGVTNRSSLRSQAQRLLAVHEAIAERVDELDAEAERLRNEGQPGRAAWLALRAHELRETMNAPLRHTPGPTVAEHLLLMDFRKAGAAEAFEELLSVKYPEWDGNW